MHEALRDIYLRSRHNFVMLPRKPYSIESQNRPAVNGASAHAVAKMFPLQILSSLYLGDSNSLVVAEERGFTHVVVRCHLSTQPFRRQRCGRQWTARSQASMAPEVQRPDRRLVVYAFCGFDASGHRGAIASCERRPYPIQRSTSQMHSSTRSLSWKMTMMVTY